MSYEYSKQNWKTKCPFSLFSSSWKRATPAKRRPSLHQPFPPRKQPYCFREAHHQLPLEVSVSFSVDHEDLCWKSEDCVGVVFSRDLVWVCAYSYFWWRPWRPFYILILLLKERIKKNTFALQGLQGYTRIHNIKPNHDWRFNELVFRGLQDILKSFPDMKKLQKPKT